MENAQEHCTVLLSLELCKALMVFSRGIFSSSLVNDEEDNCLICNQEGRNDFLYK